MHTHSLRYKPPPLKRINTNAARCAFVMEPHDFSATQPCLTHLAMLQGSELPCCQQSFPVFPTYPFPNHIEFAYSIFFALSFFFLFCSLLLCVVRYLSYLSLYLLSVVHFLLFFPSDLAKVKKIFRRDEIQRKRAFFPLSFTHANGINRRRPTPPNMSNK